MKTIEEKAKAYDEALERAKKTYDATGNDIHHVIIENIFPQLAKSEDEKIREQVIDIIQSLGTGVIPIPVNCDKILAWLEKQKESLHISESCKENQDSLIYEDEKVRKEIEQSAKEYYKENYAGDNPQGRNVVIQSYIDGALAYLEKQKEQKPVECGEEDKFMIEHIIRILDSLAGIAHGRYIVEVKWLKDLLLRLAPMTHWKPSDEQMEAFEESLMSVAHTENKIILESLLEQLKKL